MKTFEKKDHLRSTLNKIEPKLNEIIRELVKEKEFIRLVKTIIDDESLQQASHEEAQDMIITNLHNECRGYITRVLALKYLYKTYFKNSHLFLDLYWDYKFHKPNKVK